MASPTDASLALLAALPKPAQPAPRARRASARPKDGEALAAQPAAARPTIIQPCPLGREVALPALSSAGARRAFARRRATHNLAAQSAAARRRVRGQFQAVSYQLAALSFQLPLSLEQKVNGTNPECI
jgi:hypothetical protein